MTANNGWTAGVQVDTDSAVLTASGIGRWKSTAGEPRAGKFFRIYLAVLGARLYIEMSDSQKKAVIVVFERIGPVDL